MATDFYGLVSKEKLKFREQSFSGTDLSKDLDDIGIVYPIKEAEGLQASFSSIVDHEYGDTILAHSEYRLARNVDDNIEYIKGICFTVVNQDPIIDKSSEAEELLGINPYVNILKESYLVSESEAREFNKEYFTKYDEILASLDFEPVFIIDDKNLSMKEIAPKKASSIWDNTLWGNSLSEYSFEVPKTTTTKKIPRKDLEKEIYILRTDINKLAKQNNFDLTVLDEGLQMMLKDNLLNFTYEELLQTRADLEDLYWDMYCQVV